MYGGGHRYALPAMCGLSGYVNGLVAVRMGAMTLPVSGDVVATVSGCAGFVFGAVAVSYTEVLKEQENMIRDTLNKIALVMMMPAVAAHELTHAVASKAVGGELLEVSTIPPKVVTEYPPGTNKWAIRVANLSPTVVGVAALTVMLPELFLLPFPLVAYIAGSWAVYTMPSWDDLTPFKESAEAEVAD